MIRSEVLLILLALSAQDLRAQYREIPLPFPDTTRFKVQFIDEMHGWVTSYRGSILQTTDGGGSWIEHSFWQDPHMRDIEFVDERHGWITARECSNTFVCFPEKLYRTADGGAIWDRRPFPDSTTITSRGYFPGFIYEPSNIDFLDSNTMVFRGYRYIISNGFFSVAESWYNTINGGTKWDSIPVPPHLNFGMLFFAKTLTDWMVVLYQRIPEFPNSVQCYLSSDGGASWKGTKTWTDIVLINSWKSDARRFMLFNCKDRISSGEHPGTFVTTDGGETWGTYPYFSVPKMGIMPQDTTIWVVDLGGGICSDASSETVDGYLYRMHPGHKRLMYPDRIRWIANAGQKVYALTTDGRLIVFDDLALSVGDTHLEKKNSPTIEAIYPNPTQRSANVSYTSTPSIPVTMCLYDVLGRIVRKEEWGETDRNGNGRRTINIGSLVEGIYQITIYTSAGSVTSTIFKH